jgi:hypothetical protein
VESGGCNAGNQNAQFFYCAFSVAAANLAGPAKGQTLQSWIAVMQTSRALMSAWHAWK